MMTAMNRFEELCFRANNQRGSIAISSFEKNTLDIINFRYAFANMSKGINFECTDDISCLGFGYVSKAYEFSMPTKMITNKRIKKFELYMPENYTDELREKNIEICLNASLGKIKGNCYNNSRYWLYYIDAIHDLLRLPSESYRKILENWILELIDLVTPGTACHMYLMHNQYGAIWNGRLRNWPMYSCYHLDFDNNRRDFGIMRSLGLEEFPSDKILKSL